jgi:uncharacterized protein with von Willebrand factor type A (vWA) domain
MTRRYVQQGADKAKGGIRPITDQVRPQPSKNHSQATESNKTIVTEHGLSIHPSWYKQWGVQIHTYSTGVATKLPVQTITDHTSD